MRQDVIVRVAGGDEYTLQASAPMTLDAARRWLDQEFARLDCVPARASGKVLFADKLLAIAQAADGAGFADAAWAAQYANAAAGALAKPLVRIDVDSATVGF
jgi:hypothetical protein